jgi:glycosyltransferase involved in cell wall biosynthesis
MNNNSSKIKVSILCLTYNHEKFIKQTLDSFLMQETNFNFEILIHDDASTDKTIKILKNYQKKHPEIIKLFFEKENQFSKGIYNSMFKILLPLAKGKYISICEGDDFFINKNKLQLQVDFLDKKLDHALCFHPVRVFFENKEEKDCIFPNKNIKKFTKKELLKNNFIRTSSVMYRRQNYKNFIKINIIPGDWFLHLYHAKFGKIGFIKKTMSTYRRHSKGLWWNAHKNRNQLVIDYTKNHLNLFFELLSLYNKNKQYKKIILNNVQSIFNEFENAYKLKIQTLRKKNKKLTKQIISSNLEKKQLQLDLDKIQSSKTYKIWQKYNKFKKIIKL